MSNKPGSARRSGALAVHEAGRAKGNDGKGMRHDATTRLRELGAALLALALASGALLALARAAWPDASASLLTLLAAAVPTLLVPLFWPGPGSSGHLRRALIFAAGVGAIALLGSAWLGAGRHLWPTTLATAGLAAAIAFGLCGCLAGLHAVLNRAAGSHAACAFTVPATALALWACAAAPAWLAPLASSLPATAGATPWLADALLALSPLAQLAAAAGNDLLRNDWFYAWSSLSDLRVDYPQPRLIAPAWIALGCMAQWALARAGAHRADAPLATASIFPALESP